MAREYHALPPGQRGGTAILAGNYGEAGAIDRYGPGDGLPPAFSGANNFWYWGPPPPRDKSAIAVNIDPALLRRLFTTSGRSPSSATAWASATTSRARRSSSRPG